MAVGGLGVNITKTYINALTPQLSERDFAIIENVGRFKLATGQQIERLHFMERSPLSRSRSRQFVLKRLVEHQVLKRIGNRPIGGADGGSVSHLYALGKAGIALAAITSAAPRRPYVDYRPHVAHTLAIAELYVCLVEAERAGKLKL